MNNFKIIQHLLWLLLLVQIGRPLETSDFYDFDKSFRLENGADKSAYLKLDTPLNFFSDVYDHIYINTQGALTFHSALNGFSNNPFPLEFASIAPFYSNIDTTTAGPETAISFSTIQSERNTRLAYEVIRRNFAVRDDFRIKSVAVATWENVGHYREKNVPQNTFQAVIINGEQDTFVQFLYPSNGINWLQGDFGDSGLPDIRAQAGFVAEDGRFFALPGSGTENANYLNQLSNHGVPGSWIYRVGNIGFENTIEEPDQSRYRQQENAQAQSCESYGRLKCHVAAVCQNNPYGFECHCKSGYYGNGLNCIKNDVPLRVSGNVHGAIGVPIDAQIQSYVVLSDGRSYTAISPITADIGYKSQLAYTLGYVIGWLFAKPIGTDNAQNGYQITGGKLTNTISVRFTDEANVSNELLIVQRFSGLNVWDQLAVDIEVRGDVPDISPDAQIEFPDVSDSYSFQSDTKIRSDGVGLILVDGRNISFAISQSIEFEKLPGSSSQLDSSDGSPIFSKVSKISAHYQNNEQALRIGMINKVVKNTPINPCTDGSSNCGSNSICIPDPDHDSYSCECKNGFTLDESEVCVDIDECSTGSNICDSNAHCYNDLGGYGCRCNDEFYGNGYQCYPRVQERPTEEPVTDTTTGVTPDIPGLAPNHWLCDQCSEHADCNEGVCVCRSGWNGNGIECSYNCPDEFVWSVDRCVSINPNSDDEDNEVPPFCHVQGCSCPTGYELIETGESQTCRLVEREEEEEKLPCDVENTCHHNANCVWVESELRNKCVCNPGFEGNGYECAEHEVSCLFENICDIHASCVYDELIGKSICKCDKKYEGDGKTCQIAPECAQNEDCTENAYCSDGICACNENYERDISDFCVPSGFCGGTFCATNAVCLWDNEQHVSYCSCPEGFLGDGIISCKSIPPTCNVKNICGLNAQCLPTDDSYACKCNSNFYGDGFICVPEINCYNQPSLCHENGRCVSTKSGYQCICNSGYIGNGTHCLEPIRQETGFLLLSQGIAAVKIPFDGKGASPIVTSSMAIGIDKDCSTGRVYWSDISTKEIYSANYDGSDKKVFISEDIISPEGVAVDWISRRIYWTDSGKDTIEVASLDDGTIRAVLINTGLVNPRGIAVDPHQNKLYWSDWNRASPKIEQSDLDGANRLTLLSAPAINLPNSLAISSQTGEVCFADAGTHKVECIEPYHRSIRSVASNLTYPFGLAVANGRLYWTDWTTKKIESSDDRGNRLPGIASLLFGNHKMYGMTAVTSDCPLFFSPCQINNGDCHENSICLLSQIDPSGKHCQPTS